MSVKDEIRCLAHECAQSLQQKINDRLHEMESDDSSHFLIYRVLGITSEEGQLIDAYQNKGRFLYRYAGTFLEEATKLCFKAAFPESGSLRIPNSLGQRPKTFEIDCLVGSDAMEIKWRDATTDGDHITKEHTRLRAIAAAGYTPFASCSSIPIEIRPFEFSRHCRHCTPALVVGTATATPLGLMSESVLESI